MIVLSKGIFMFILSVVASTTTKGTVEPEMTITTSEDYFMPTQPLVINCTSSVLSSDNIISLGVNNKSIVTFKYDGQCRYILSRENVPQVCNVECGCSLNGRSIFYVYTHEDRDNDLTIICSTFVLNNILNVGKLELKKRTVEIETSEDYFITSQPLEINCTSLVLPTDNIIALTVNNRNVVTFKYDGQCRYILPGGKVPQVCNFECGCSLNGRSIFYVYTHEDGDDDLTIICTTIALDNTRNVGKLQLKRALSITSAIITPTGNNAIISVVTDATQIFTCSTDAGRPAASIKWYIGEQNVTNPASSVITQDGTMYVTSSALTYTGKDVDHNKQIYCEAFNIAGSQKVKSNNKTLNIQVLVRTLTLIPAGVNNVVTVTLGDTREFTCITDPVRPAAWIQWYFGSRNVTNNAVPKLQPDGTKFIAFSRLTIAGNKNDQNKTIHCEAQNIPGMPIVKSLSKILYIGLQPEPVSGISVVCDGTTLVVLWQSGSDRGSKQIFGVVWQNLQSDSIMRSENLTDPGIGSIVHYTTNLISAKAYYTINIESTNVYGTVRSNKLVYCNTIGSVTASMPVTESTILYAVVGSGTAMIVSIAVAAFIVVYAVKRKRRSPAENRNVYEETKNKTGAGNIYNELDEISRDRRNREGNCDRTYEEMDTAQTNLRSNVSKTEL